MQVVADSSALLAVLLGEPDRERFHAALLGHDVVMSVVSITEVMLAVQGRRGAAALDRLDRALSYRIEPRGVDLEDVALLRQALMDFGHGRQRPPALNFGDLFAYALAKRLGLPLLYKGDDFTRTDVQAVVV